LKTPLAVIIAHGEIALRKDRDPRDYKIAIAAMMEAARMMSLIIEKLLKLARFSSDRFTLQMEDVRLDGIIDRSLKLLRPLAGEKGIAIAMPAGEKYTVRGDSEALLETFVNILDNAIKYNVPGEESQSA